MRWVLPTVTAPAAGVCQDDGNQHLQAVTRPCTYGWRTGVIALLGSQRLAVAERDPEPAATIRQE
jgi:hypothetical protein